MAIVAEILLADSTLPLVGLARSIPSGEIAVANSVPLGDDELRLTVSVPDDSREAFERELDAQPEVLDAAAIGQTGDGWFYQLTVVDDSGLVDAHDHEEFEGVLVDASVTAEGLREQKVFADYEAFRTLRDRCQVHDIPFELLHIAADPENPGERDQFGLTEKQYQAISLAFARGYYDSPRQTSTQELAAELDISAAAASDLLRRAENQLISQTIGPEEYLNGLTH